MLPALHEMLSFGAPPSRSQAAVLYNAQAQPHLLGSFVCQTVRPTCCL